VDELDYEKIVALYHHDLYRFAYCLAGMGCKVLEWHGHRVTLLCLKFGGKHVDVFIINASDLRGVSLGAAPDFASEHGTTTATWRREGKIYFLAGNIPESDLKQLL
jgi:hypothetical protein